jgi:hypothetical protein
MQSVATKSTLLKYAYSIIINAAWMKKTIAFASINNGVLMNTPITRRYLKISIEKDYLPGMVGNLFCFINSLLFINNQNKYAV